MLHASIIDLPVVGSIAAADCAEPFLAVVIELSAERIASLLLDTGAPNSPAGPDSRSAFGVGHTPPTLLDAIARLLALLDQPADIPAIYTGIEREILWRLLSPARRVLRRLLRRLTIQPRIPPHVRHRPQSDRPQRRVGTILISRRAGVPDPFRPLSPRSCRWATNSSPRCGRSATKARPRHSERWRVGWVGGRRGSDERRAGWTVDGHLTGLVV